MSLGINKDLEPLARRWRRAGGTVCVTRRNHVLWLLPDGTKERTGLTMSNATAKWRGRALERALKRFESGDVAA